MAREGEGEGVPSSKGNRGIYGITRGGRVIHVAWQRIQVPNDDPLDFRVRRVKVSGESSESAVRAWERLDRNIARRMARGLATPGAASTPAVGGASTGARGGARRTPLVSEALT